MVDMVDAMCVCLRIVFICVVCVFCVDVLLFLFSFPTFFSCLNGAVLYLV